MGGAIVACFARTTGQSHLAGGGLSFFFNRRLVVVWNSLNGHAMKWCHPTGRQAEEPTEKCVATAAGHPLHLLKLCLGSHLWLKRRQPVMMRRSIGDCQGGARRGIAKCRRSVCPRCSRAGPASRDAKGKPTLRSAADVEKVRGQLRQAVGELDAYLSTGGANGAAWGGFYRSISCGPSFGRVLGHRPGNSNRSIAAFAPTTRDWSCPSFARCAVALRSLIDAEEQVRHPATSEDLDSQLERLAASLDAFADERSSDEQRTIGQVLEWLDRHGQAPHLVAEVRQRLSQPNLYVHLSDKLVAAGSDRTINDDENIQDVILGTSINGQGHTVGARAHPAGSERTASHV